MNWWMDALKSVYGGGVFCALVMIGLNFFIIVGTNLAGSRLAWSMARDKAFPFSEYLAVVNKRFGIPLRAMLAIVVIDLIIGLIVLASDIAFESIISGGGVTLQVGYVTPVIILLVRGRHVLPPHPNFDLGKWGYPINIISVCWSLIIIVMYSFPMVSRRSPSFISFPKAQALIPFKYVPVTVDWMNYSIVIVGATIVFPGAYFVFSARHKYIKESNSVLEENVVVIDGVAIHGAEVILEK
jgi:choline transport protein